MKTTWRSASLVASRCGRAGADDGVRSGKGHPSTGGQNVGATAAAGGYGDERLRRAERNGYGADPRSARRQAAKPAGQLAVCGQQEARQGADRQRRIHPLPLRQGHRRARRSRTATATARPPGRRCPRTTPRPPPASTRRCSARSPGPTARKQLTIGGWPMYRYAKDTKAGRHQRPGRGRHVVRLGARRQEGDAVPPCQPLTCRTVGPQGPEARRDRRRQERHDRLPLHEGPGLARSKSACIGACLEKWPVVAPGRRERHQGRQEEGPDDLHPPRRRQAADGQLLADLHLLRRQRSPVTPTVRASAAPGTPSRPTESWSARRASHGRLARRRPPVRAARRGRIRLAGFPPLSASGRRSGAGSGAAERTLRSAFARRSRHVPRQ